MFERIIGASICALTIPLVCHGAPTTPSWWLHSSSKLVDSGYTNKENNYPINVGQLKNAIAASHAYLDATLSGRRRS